MAAAIAVPVASWIGAIGASAAVASAVGTIVAYAVIGAAIGAISSAVMGGDIGKGALYGAIGGAVMGGISVAFNAAGQSAIQAGAAEMSQNGYSAGMATYNASINMSTSAAGTLANGAAGKTTLEGVGAGIKGGVGDSSLLNLNLSKDGWLSSQAGGQTLAGAAQGIMGYMSNKDKLAAENSSREDTQQWQAEQAALDRENRLKLAEISAGGGGSSDALAVATANNKAAMERQQQQQAAEEQMRKNVRAEKLDDRSSFGQSVVSASEQFKAKTASIKSFMNTPTWLQPFKQSQPQVPTIQPIIPQPASDQTQTTEGATA